MKWLHIACAWVLALGCVAVPDEKSGHSVRINEVKMKLSEFRDTIFLNKIKACLIQSFDLEGQTADSELARSLATQASRNMASDDFVQFDYAVAQLVPDSLLTLEVESAYLVIYSMGGETAKECYALGYIVASELYCNRVIFGSTGMSVSPGSLDPELIDALLNDAQSGEVRGDYSIAICRVEGSGLTCRSSIRPELEILRGANALFNTKLR